MTQWFKMNDLEFQKALLILVLLLRGQRLQAHHLVSKWSSGNLGHIAGPGPQDYLGNPPVQTVGTNRRPKMRAGPQPS